MSSERVSQQGAVIEPCEAEKGCEVVSCAVCMEEVPVSVAKTAEGPDYVHYFCGLDCLGKWETKAKNSG